MNGTWLCYTFTRQHVIDKGREKHGRLRLVWGHVVARIVGLAARGVQYVWKSTWGMPDTDLVRDSSINTRGESREQNFP